MRRELCVETLERREVLSAMPVIPAADVVPHPLDPTADVARECGPAATDLAIDDTALEAVLAAPAETLEPIGQTDPGDPTSMPTVVYHIIGFRNQHERAQFNDPTNEQGLHGWKTHVTRDDGTIVVYIDDAVIGKDDEPSSPPDTSMQISGGFQQSVPFAERLVERPLDFPTMINPHR